MSALCPLGCFLPLQGQVIQGIARCSGDFRRQFDGGFGGQFGQQQAQHAFGSGVVAGVFAFGGRVQQQGKFALAAFFFSR